MSGNHSGLGKLYAVGLGAATLAALAVWSVWFDIHYGPAAVGGIRGLAISALQFVFVIAIVPLTVTALYSLVRAVAWHARIKLRGGTLPDARLVRY